MRRIILLALLIIVAMLILPTYGEVKLNSDKHDIPVIAQIMGLRVGVDTIEELESIIGAGAPCMGGHPHGGRAWYIKPCKIYVYVDGFDYNSKKGRIIDTIKISTNKKEMKYCFDYENPKPIIPQVNICNKSIGWFRKILPGESKNSIDKLTSGLPKPLHNKNNTIWTMSGIYKTFNKNERINWIAELTFKTDKLLAIEVRLD